jgi:hypothetical protein
VASREPATGPTIHPAVSAIRTIETTPSPTGLAVACRSSWTAANSCEPAAPAKARTTALITNGIHSWLAAAMAHQPRNPARAHTPKEPEPPAGAVRAGADEVSGDRGGDVREVVQAGRGQRDVQVVDEEQGDLRGRGRGAEPGQEQRDGRAAVERRVPHGAHRGRSGGDVCGGELW